MAMEQQELGLDTSMINIMHKPRKPISWRRAHNKSQPCGSGRSARKSIKLDPVIVNAANEKQKKDLLEKIREFPGAAPRTKSGFQQQLI